MQARGSPPSPRPDLIPEMQTFGSGYTPNKCFLIASVGQPAGVSSRAAFQAAKKDSAGLNLGTTRRMKRSLTATVATRLTTGEPAGAPAESYEWNK